MSRRPALAVSAAELARAVALAPSEPGEHLVVLTRSRSTNKGPSRRLFAVVFRDHYGARVIGFGPCEAAARAKASVRSVEAMREYDRAQARAVAEEHRAAAERGRARRRRVERLRERPPSVPPEPMAA